MAVDRFNKKLIASDEIKKKELMEHLEAINKSHI